MSNESRPPYYQPPLPPKRPNPVLALALRIWKRLAWWGKALVVLFVLGCFLNLIGYKSDTNTITSTSVATNPTVTSTATPLPQATQVALLNTTVAPTATAVPTKTPKPTSTSKPTDTAKPTETAKPTALAPVEYYFGKPVYKPGDQVIDNNYGMMIGQVEQAQSFDCNKQASPGTILMSVEITLTNVNRSFAPNTGLSDLTFNDIVDGKNLDYIGFACKKPALPDHVDFKKGTSISGWATFEVAAQAKNLIINYTPDYFSSNASLNVALPDPNPALAAPPYTATALPVASGSSSGSATGSRKQTADSSPCLEGQIKGNINSHIYHTPDGQFYAKTKDNVECFDTETQAQAAGFKASLK